MRTRYATGVAALAAIAALALIPIGATAAPTDGLVHHPPLVRALTIHALPNPINAGDPVVIFGRLFGRHHADRLVVLYHHLAGLRGRFSPVQTTQTDAGGAYEFTRADGRVDTNRSWFVAAYGSRSRIVSERVAALISVNVTGPGGVPEPDGSVLQTGPGFTYTFAGNVDPGRPGALVLLQRQGGNNGNNWATIGRGHLDASGNYSIPHVFVFPSSGDGSANVRIYMPNDVRNIRSASDPLSYEIEQTQNPSLTINAVANPIVEGQADAIKGIDAQGSGRLLTLWGRTAHRGFSVLGTTVTTAGGAYTFNVMPVFNTAYRVVGTRGSGGSTGSTGSTGTTGSSGTTGAFTPKEARVQPPSHSQNSGAVSPARCRWAQPSAVHSRGSS